MKQFVGYLIKKAVSKGKVSPTIKSVKPNVGKTPIKKAVDDVKLTALKARGQMKKQSQDFDRDIQKVKSKLGQSMQKLKGEKVTESGVSKGKDIIKKATGGRVGRRFGGDTMKNKKSDVQKIKETFSPKGKNLKPVDKNKNPGLAKLPIEVRNKMGYAKKGGRA
mgnify:CR=1 FL=1